MSDYLVSRLRECAEEKQQEAWGRADGGQDLSIGAALADEAADRISALEAALAKADELADQFDLALQELDEYNLQLTSENYNCPDHNRARAAYRQARDATR